MIRLEHFLVCDDAREESSGRLTILGLCPTLDLFASGPGLFEQLTIVVVLNGMKGVSDFKWAMSVTHGKDVILPRKQMLDKRQPDPLSHTLRYKMTNFPVLSDGLYRFVVEFQIGGTVATFIREVNVHFELPPGAAKPST